MRRGGVKRCEIQAMLREAGIDAEIKYYPGDVLFAPAGMGGILQFGRFDLSMAGWYSGIDPDDSSQYRARTFRREGTTIRATAIRDMEAAQKIALTSYDRATRDCRVLTRFRNCWHATTRNLHLVDCVKWSRSALTFTGFDPNPVIESWNAWQWSI